MWGTGMGPHSSLLEENSVVLKPIARSSERRVCARLRARAPEDVVHGGYSQEPGWEAHSVLTFFPKMGSGAFC